MTMSLRGSWVATTALDPSRRRGENCVTVDRIIARSRAAGGHSPTARSSRNGCEDRREAADGAFVGMKRFESFTDDDAGEKATMVQVDRLEIVEVGGARADPRAGIALLWKMVRRLVGVLAAVGRRELAASAAARLVEGTEAKSPSRAALTAPAAELFLEAVLYQGDDGPEPIRPVITIE